MSELLVIENISAVELYSGNGVDELLAKIAEEVESLVPDTSTAKGRKEIASTANKVAKSKVFLDGLGKDLVSDWKTKSKAVDAERKKVRDQLDALKAKARQPLTDWEGAENKRIENHKEDINRILMMGAESVDCWDTISLETMTDRLAWIEEAKIDDSWEEFANEAAIAKDLAITNIKKAIDKRTKYDNEQAELERLRLESAARAKADEEDRLRKEGEKKAKAEAEELAEKREQAAAATRQRVAKAAADEIERVNNKHKEAEQAKIAADRRAKDAEDDAKQAKINANAAIKIVEHNAVRDQALAIEAAKAERDRIEAENLEKDLAAKNKREKDKKHTANINNEAGQALLDLGLSFPDAKAVVLAIADGKIPHISIRY